MVRVNTYLNFQGQTEEAFAFYAATFGTEVTMLSRYSDMPAMSPGELPAAGAQPGDARRAPDHRRPRADGNRHARSRWVSKPGSATTPPCALTWTTGPRPTACTARYRDGGSEGSPMADMPWGAYWGVVLDRYGIRWMVNHTPTA